jgi:phospholipid/cholesterol/gamma-HCH transport system permease protein
VTTPSDGAAAPSARGAVVSPGVDRLATGVYGGASFFAGFFAQVWQRPLHLRALVEQCFQVGVRSLPLISLTGFVVGLVFTKQSRPSLAAFGAQSWLPSLITIAIIRALAPLVTALICAGRVGSNIGAELGSMRVTEQIEAMEVSAINPFKYLVVTRTLATTLMLPILTMYCSLVGLAGAFLNVRGKEGTSLAAFVSDGFSTIEFLDLWSSLVRSVVFGFTIGLISSYQGYNATRGTEGVGRAANAAVVLSTFAIFIEEMLIVQVLGWFREE